MAGIRRSVEVSRIASVVHGRTFGFPNLAVGVPSRTGGAVAIRALVPADFGRLTETLAK